MTTWQIPAIALTCLTIIIIFARGIRALSRHERDLENLNDFKCECKKNNYVDMAVCAKAQQDCRIQQSDENTKIVEAIKLLSERFEKSQVEMQSKFEKRQQNNHDELMKINKSLGRIEGVIGRHKFDE